MLKLLFERASHRLRGVHIIGEKAAELVHIGQAVLAFGGPVDYFVDNVFNYPTLSEAYKVAALNGLMGKSNLTPLREVPDLAPEAACGN